MSGRLIVACVAPADLLPDVDGLTGEVRVDARRADLTASDAAAVEHVLRIAQAWGGRPLVVADGPPAIDAVLVDLAALGCEVIRIGPHPDTGRRVPAGPTTRSGPELAGDAETVGRRLARAILTVGTPDLVVCGDRSADRGVGAVPAYLAHHLGLEQALGLVSLTVGDPGHLSVERRLDGGWRERLDVTGAAVLSVEAAGVRLRRAGLVATLASGPASVRIVEDTDRPGLPPGGSVAPPSPYRPRTRPVPAPDGDPRHRLLALTGALSNREPPRIAGPLPAEQAAAEVLEFLRRSGIGD
jgi:electron transfer flavoprotein beta subunit